VSCVGVGVAACAVRFLADSFCLGSLGDALVGLAFGMAVVYLRLVLYWVVWLLMSGHDTEGARGAQGILTSVRKRAKLFLTEGG
jgi:hypothetical protein